MYQKTTLRNGVRILTEEINHVRSISMGIWVNVGSRDEIESNSGISHFIEHMMFKGTKKRTPKDIAEELDAVGGQLNAFTTKEYTCYHAKVLDEHLDLALELLSDMLFNSNFNSEDLDKEKNVILEEIKMYEDAPDELVHDLFTNNIWHGHPLGRPIIGTEKNVKEFSSEDLIAYYKKHYTPQNIIITLAGNIKHQTAVDKLSPVFSSLQGEEPKRKLISPQGISKMVLQKKDTEQVHLVVGSPGYALDHPDIYTVQLINTVLGGGLSSRLFQEIREQRGLVYSIYSYHLSYKDTGVFAVYAGLSKANAEKTMVLVSKELSEIPQKGITEKELQRAKDQLKGGLLLSLENVNSRMTRLGKSEMYLGKVLETDEIIEKMYSVTNEDVQRVANEIFNPEKYSLAAIGSWSEEQEVDQIFQMFKNV